MVHSLHGSSSVSLLGTHTDMPAVCASEAAPQPCRHTQSVAQACGGVEPNVVAKPRSSPVKRLGLVTL